MFNPFKLFRTTRGGDEMMKLYENALNTANSYAPYLFGPGSGVFASAVLNEVLAEGLFSGNGVEELRTNNPEEVRAAAKEMMDTAPVMRELIVQTLWVKWLADRAHNRTAAIQTLESSWAFLEYASDRGVPTLKEFEQQILLAHQEIERQRAEWIEAIEEARKENAE